MALTWDWAGAQVNLCRGVPFQAARAGRRRSAIHAIAGNWIAFRNLFWSPGVTFMYSDARKSQRSRLSKNLFAHTMSLAGCRISKLSKSQTQQCQNRAGQEPAMREGG